MDKLNSIVSVLKKDLLKSIRKNKDEVKIEENIIYITISEYEVFSESFRQLANIIMDSAFYQHANDIQFIITNGSEKKEINIA